MSGHTHNREMGAPQNSKAPRAFACEALAASIPRTNFPIVELCGFKQRRLGRLDSDRSLEHLAISELLKNFQKLREGRIHFFVEFLISLNRLHKLELIPSHFPFFGGLAIILKPAPRSAAALERVAAFSGLSALGTVVACRFGRFNSTIEPGSSIHPFF